jgi:RHS repeat-associated protein
VGTTTFTYDSRGNLLTDGNRTMGYDADNLLTQVTISGASVNYLYDWEHRLARRTDASGSDSRYIYDEDWNVLCDIDAISGVVQRRYIYGPRTDEVLSETQSGTTYFHCKNHLGSTTALLNGDTVCQRFSYDEYGAPQVRTPEGYPTGSLPLTRYLFAGREYDKANGLYNYRHRVYHPSLGRFVQADPIGFDGGVNFYAYCHNDPLNRLDPYGLDDLPGYDSLSRNPRKACEAFRNFEKMAQGDNTAANRTFKDACKAIAKKLGKKKLKKKEVRKLHEEVSGQGLDYDDIVQTGLEIL